MDGDTYRFYGVDSRYIGLCNGSLFADTCCCMSLFISVCYFVDESRFRMFVVINGIFAFINVKVR